MCETGVAANLYIREYVPMGIDSLQYPIVVNLYPWVHFSIHAKMYLGVNSLPFPTIGYRFARFL